MKRCIRCTLPDTRPDTHFNDSGLCSACSSFDARATVDWSERRADLERILEGGKNSSGYDCIVASSGGKDSHFQVRTLLDMGAKPLIVTARTDYITPIGQRNIDNLARYADTYNVVPNIATRLKLCRLGFELVGDISWPEHAAIFSTPIRVAAQLGIPLVFYGENPQNQYGGPPGSGNERRMTRRWVHEYGGLLGLRANDFVGMEGLAHADMHPYMLPEDDALGRVETYFLGQFVPWDSQRNIYVARSMGMVGFKPSVANLWDLENVDNLFTAVHDHLMYRKYGFGRGGAQMAVDVRHGLIGRDYALDWLGEYDGIYPDQYAGLDMSVIPQLLGTTDAAYWGTMDSFTNWGLFGEEVDHRPILKPC